MAAPQVEFVSEPPPANTSTAFQRGSKYDPVAEVLKANKGQWAILFRSVTSGVASALRAGKYSAFTPQAEWESTARRSASGDKNRVDIYVRYVGEPDEELAAFVAGTVTDTDLIPEEQETSPVEEE